MNHVTLIGRLTADPELKFTQGGAAYCNFTLAVDRRADKDGNKSADFIPCVVWNKTAENLAKFKSKGDQIAVDGRIQIDSYEKDGQRRYSTKVVCNYVEYVWSSKGRNSDAQAVSGASTEAISSSGQAIGTEVSFTDDDLPF